VLFCKTRLPCPLFEDAADEPAAREIRVECQGALDQPHHRSDILAEIRQRERAIRQDAWVFAGYFQRSCREPNTFRTVSLPIFAHTVIMKPKAANRCIGEGRPVTRIALDRLLQETQRLGNSPCRCPDHCGRAQIEIVCGQVISRTARGTSSLGGLQRRFDDTCDTGGHSVLKVEHIVERAVEAVGPDVSAILLCRSIAQ
jgi:hypothetical protein